MFEKLTLTDCDKACTAERCVFVDKPYCAHPYKGGPQGVDISNPTVIDRISTAKKLLKLKAVQEEATP